MLFVVYIFKQFVSQNQISGSNYCGPDAPLDTKTVHIDLCCLLDVISVIRHKVSFDDKWHKWHKIWQKLIWPILVSKVTAGPQQLHPLIWFWLNFFKKMSILKGRLAIFLLYQFRYPLYFLQISVIPRVLTLFVMAPLILLNGIRNHAFWKSEVS